LIQEVSNNQEIVTSEWQQSIQRVKKANLVNQVS